MKFTMKSMLLLSASMLTLASCSNESPIEDVEEEGVIKLNVLHPSQLSRATDIGFEKNDSIGLYVTASDVALQIGGNEVNNECFVYDGSAWNSMRKVYWNIGSHDVYAYYPYSKLLNDVENYSFSVKLDQSELNTDGMSAYEASDFLWASAKGVAASNSPVTLQFTHKLSNVVVEIVKGEAYEGTLPSDAEVYIHSTVPKALIDLSTGDAAKDDYAGEETIKMRKLADDKFVACVVPQRIGSRRPLVEVIMKGVSYLMEGKITFKPGCRHTIQVTIDMSPEQSKIEIGGEINGWY